MHSTYKHPYKYINGQLRSQQLPNRSGQMFPVRLISERVLDIDDSAEDVGDGAAYHRPLFLWVVNETCQQDVCVKRDYAEIATSLDKWKINIVE